ncbi:MAG: nucleotidyltransferase family protein [Oscillospiraceae bacterium]|nr:nucleotidyltransferase family protein [Oscillospiraceae bacterium]
MKICGITAEYNPFHKGHAHQIEMARQAGATHVLVVMSGNFVQRGVPAMLDKRVRARAALCCGADLVLELPLPFATASAETFAYGALSVMQGTGCVDLVSFGAEDALEQIQRALDALLSPEFDPIFRLKLAEGDSYAATRARTVADIAGEDTAAVLARPNNILAVEYLKAAHRLDFHPQWAAIPRRGAGHDQPGAAGGFMSASHLRHLLELGDWASAAQGLPEVCLPLYQQAFVSGEGPVRLAALERNMLAVLRTRSLDWLKQLPDVSEGLENRLYAGIRQARSIVELYQLVQSKRYPQSRARRMALHGYLGVTADMQKKQLPYLRILGIGPGGEEILFRMKKTAVRPVSQSLARLSSGTEDAALFAGLEASATDQYVLGMPKPLPCGYEFTAPVIKC